MSPQPTQAHLDKATCWIVKRPLNVSHQIDSLAQLIADSEAQAAQAEFQRVCSTLTKLLGSACDKLRAAHKTEVKELYARAEKAEAKLKQTQSSALTWSRFAGEKAAGADIARQRAERAEAEVERLKELLRIESASAQHALAAAERAEADRNEFFRDTARMDWLQAHALPQHSPNISISDLGRHYNGFPGSFRAAIDATMKGSK